MVSFTEAFLLLAREGGAKILNTLYITYDGLDTKEQSRHGVKNSHIRRIITRSTLEEKLELQKQVLFFGDNAAPKKIVPHLKIDVS